jgi:hypothetical protein
MRTAATEASTIQIPPAVQAILANDRPERATPPRKPRRWPDEVVVTPDRIWALDSGRASALLPGRFLAALGVPASTVAGVRIGDVHRLADSLPPAVRARVEAVLGVRCGDVVAANGRPDAAGRTGASPGKATLVRTVGGGPRTWIGSTLAPTWWGKSDVPGGRSDVAAMEVQVDRRGDWFTLGDLARASLRALEAGFESTPPPPSASGCVVLGRGGPRIGAKRLAANDVLSAWSMRVEIAPGATLADLLRWLRGAPKAIEDLVRFRIRVALSRGRAPAEGREAIGDRVVVQPVEVDRSPSYWVQLYLFSGCQSYSLSFCSARAVARLPLSLERADLHERGAGGGRPFEISLGDLVEGVAGELGFMCP